MQLLKQAILALLPPGPLWDVQDDAELDRLLDGMAGSLEAIKGDLSGLARIRSPLHTPILSDLEYEFGILPDATLDESVRRVRLQSVKTSRNGDGSLDALQDALTAAGFDVLVHANDPPVDPGFFLSYAPSAIFGAAEAQFGRNSMGVKRGELLVNDLFDSKFYTIPNDAGYWPAFFFVGGAATRNEAGQLTDIASAVVPAARRWELARTIIRYKPMSTWAGLIARYE